MYPTRQLECLQEARKAQPLADIPLYVVKQEVPAPFAKNWPERFFWYISERPPFHGVSGYFYTPRPEYYILNPNALNKEELVPAEDPEAAARIQAHLDREFEALQERDRERFKEAST